MNDYDPNDSRQSFFVRFSSGTRFGEYYRKFFPTRSAAESFAASMKKCGYVNIGVFSNFE